MRKPINSVMAWNRFPVLLFFWTLLSCVEKRANLAIDQDLAPRQFVGSFPEIPLPWTLTEAMLSSKPGDSLLINQALVKRYIPDSVYKKHFRRAEHPRFHIIGRISVKEGETYILVRASYRSTVLAYLLCFDLTDSFRVSKPVLQLPVDARYKNEFSVDRRHVMSKIRSRTGRDGQLTYRKDAWVYNTAGVFTLVLTESNEPIDEEVYNPIDTFPATRPLSGDYRLSARDFLSIRDGHSDKRLTFFLHMERKEWACTGELRGELNLVTPTLAHYDRADDHCILEFSFRRNAVTVRELSACGNRRSVRCTFSGTYRRKAVPVKKKK
ncbi:MAG: hypothetical protein FJX89_02770 [Bacteroidetes bacterium]|nr:hypothetical protein [Bacteroidota bacterium]